MAIDLYYLPGSAPCRSVQMAAKAVGVDLNLKLTNLMTGEHLKPEFLALNPTHTIPTINDNGFSLWESRAIIVYLAEKYGKTDSLYPKDAQKRAVVNQRLYFDQGTLYQRLADYYYPQIFAKQPADPEKLTKLEDALKFLDGFLEKSEYAAGDNLTLADISLVATVSTLEIAKLDLSKFSNVTKWLAKCKATCPGYDINEAGLQEFKKFF